MADQFESGYAFLMVLPMNNGLHRVDLFVPSHMLGRLQLVSGCGVLADVVGDFTELHLRPSKGTQDTAEANPPFIATIRFPNKAGVLSAFLTKASEQGIYFTAIRTFGSRGEARADIMCEGFLPRPIREGFIPSHAVARELLAAARPPEGEGEVIDASLLNFRKHTEGSVLTSLYTVDLPLLRGHYKKVRFHFDLEKSRAKLLSEFVDRVSVIRAQIDAAHMMLTFDLDFARNDCFLFSFEAAELRRRAEVTKTILELFSKEMAGNSINIDAIDAFEFHKWKRASAGGSGDIKRTGVIEGLFTAVALDVEHCQSLLRARLKAKDFSERAPDFDIVPLDKRLGIEANPYVPEEKECSAFRKLLMEGRYAFHEQVGAGTFGGVARYFDLLTGEVVACKHLNPAFFIKYGGGEVRNLDKAGAQAERSRHVVSIFDFFYDGDIPIIVMESLVSVLAQHETCPERSSDQRLHRRPASVQEFAEMAIHLLRGLESLHSADTSDDAIMQGDIKPSNVGFTLEGDRPVWKLLDFGLSKAIPKGKDGEFTTVHGGTLFYVSPEQALHLKYSASDVYSLGIMLFEVWNGWSNENGLRKHPSKAFQHLDNGYYPEVWACIEQGEPPFKRVPEWPDRTTKWSKNSPILEGEIDDPASAELRDIVYDMIQLSPERRPSAATVRERIEQWQGKLLGAAAPQAT